MIDNDIIKDLKFPTLEFTNNASGKLLLNIMYAGRSKSSNKQKYYLYYHCGNKECNHSRGRVRGSEIFNQIVSVLDQMKCFKADYDKYVKDPEEYINKKLNGLKTE